MFDDSGKRAEGQDEHSPRVARIGLAGAALRTRIVLFLKSRRRYVFIVSVLKVGVQTAEMYFFIMHENCNENDIDTEFYALVVIISDVACVSCVV